MEKIKNCPFCGGPASMDDDSTPFSPFPEECFVSCEYCGARGPAFEDCRTDISPEELEQMFSRYRNPEKKREAIKENLKMLKETHEKGQKWAIWAWNKREG